MIIAADNSAAMLEVARTAQPREVLQRVRTMQTSAFAIDLPDRSVDCIFSMRLMHHVGEQTHRLAILREFHRVARDSVIVSLWVDGNYKAWKRARLERARARRDRRGVQNRFVLPASTVEQEFRAAGFRILGHHDLLPHYAMWRVYILRRAGS
jgi:cyclopropane fatty-acyl-phospholipid synthase-like methyltransferase